MKLSLDRTFRVVWLVVGGLLLLFLVGAGVLIGIQWIRNAGAGEEAIRVASEAQPRQEPRAVRYGRPLDVRGTDTRIVLVSYGAGDELAAGYASTSRGGGTWVNAVFLDAEGARLLLDRPAYIRDIAFPEVKDTDYLAPDSLQTWITYVMAVDDADRNGRLDHRDGLGLYMTDLEGRNLRPVLRPPLRYVSHHVMEAGRMLVYALEPPAGRAVDEKQMRQRAFTYDIASGVLSPYVALDTAVARAAQVVAR